MLESEKMQQLINRNKGIYDDEEKFITVYKGKTIKARSLEELKRKVGGINVV